MTKQENEEKIGASPGNNPILRIVDSLGSDSEVHFAQILILALALTGMSADRVRLLRFEESDILMSSLRRLEVTCRSEDVRGVEGMNL